MLTALSTTELLIDMETNRIHQGNTLDVLKTFPDESIDCVICSPPYFGLRDYGEDVSVVWGGDSKCQHEWGNKIEPRGSKSGKPGPNATVGARFVQDEVRRGEGSNFCLKCGAWRGQLGLEPTLDLYLDHMLAITTELKRVLKKTGTLFWNHGDSYASGWFTRQGKPKNVPQPKRGKKLTDYSRIKSISESEPYIFQPDVIPAPEKSLLLQAHRLAIRMVDEQGWILRNIIIWHKPNCMPSSVKDRFTVDYEPIFFFSKSKRYFFETQYEPYSESYINDTRPHGVSRQRFYEESKYVKEGMIDKAEGNWKELPSKDLTLGRNKRAVWTIKENQSYWTDRLLDNAVGGAQRETLKFWLDWIDKNPEGTYEQFYNEFKSKKISKYQNMKWQDGIDTKDSAWGNFSSYLSMPNPDGKKKGTTWSICPQPFPEAHFAVYPEKLCETPIKAGCPEFICRKCGKAREKIYEKTSSTMNIRVRDVKEGRIKFEDRKASDDEINGYGKEQLGSLKEKGYTDCQCGAGFDSGVVLDPFMGAGTTGVVALKNNRKFIGIELNPKYIEIAEKRLKPYLEQRKLGEF